MKKIYCILIALCVAAVAAAELNPPHRYFEIGADVHAGVSNNWFQVSDFFNETTISRSSLIRYNNPIKRTLFGTSSRKSYSN